MWPAVRFLVVEDETAADARAWAAEFRDERVALFGHLGGTPVPPDNSKRPPWK